MMDRVTKIGVALLWMLALAALSVGCGDVLPPSIPENLVVNATSSSTMDVSWDASTARTEIKEYRIFRDGDFLMATNATSFNDSGLVNSTEYCYRVQAEDSDGNRSDKSDKECDKTFGEDDTENPTAPSNLTATVISSTQIDLAWDPSTDDTGIKRYDIYRDAAFHDSVNGITNSYSDTGLIANTPYCYFVNAVDLVDKQSNPSNFICNTTAL
jgi:chitodextrinase